MNRAIIILSNDEYIEDIKDNEMHNDKIRKYCKNHNIPLNIISVSDAYQRYLASLGIMNINHGIPVCVYIPEEPTYFQITWILEHSDYFKKHKNDLSYAVVNKSGYVISMFDSYVDKNTIDKMFNYLKDNLNNRKELTL